MEATVFSSIAGLVTVKELLEPLGPTMQVECTVADAWKSMCSAALEGGYWEVDRASLVYEANELVGVVWYEDLDGERGLVRDCMVEIHAASLVSSNTTALDAVGLLCRESQPCYYVLDRSDLIGTLTYAGLFKLPFRLCLFALTLELEQTALKLLRVDAAASWSTLSEGRKDKARTVFQRRYGRLPDPDRKPFTEMLDCTYFSDKGRMLKKRGLVPPGWTSAIEGHFDKAEDLRNMCAHPTAEDGAAARIPERKALGAFVERTGSLLAALQATST